MTSIFQVFPLHLTACELRSTRPLTTPHFTTFDCLCILFQVLSVSLAMVPLATPSSISLYIFIFTPSYMVDMHPSVDHSTSSVASVLSLKLFLGVMGWGRFKFTVGCTFGYDNWCRGGRISVLVEQQPRLHWHNSPLLGPSTLFAFNLWSNYDISLFWSPSSFLYLGLSLLYFFPIGNMIFSLTLVLPESLSNLESWMPNIGSCITQIMIFTIPSFPQILSPLSSFIIFSLLPVPKVPSWISLLTITFRLALKV